MGRTMILTAWIISIIVTAAFVWPFTNQAEAEHIRVTDLESHLVMCERPDTINRNECIINAYETWE